MKQPGDRRNPSPSYAFARGTCPRCGSGEVVHWMFGMPDPGSLETLPEWVRLGGCCLTDDMTDRECSVCGHEWATDNNGNPLPAAPPPNGTLVSANLWNFDGRHNDHAAGVYPPDVSNPNEVLIGVLVKETVNSAFGTYERYRIVGDDGRFNWAEESTIKRL